MKKICIVLVLLLLVLMTVVSFVGCNNIDDYHKQQAFNEAVNLLKSYSEYGGNVAVLDDVTFKLSELSQEIEMATDKFKVIINADSDYFTWLIVDYGFSMSGNMKCSAIKDTTTQLKYNGSTANNRHSEIALRYEASQELRHILIVFNSYLVNRGVSVRDLGFTNFVSVQIR